MFSGRLTLKPACGENSYHLTQILASGVNFSNLENEMNSHFTNSKEYGEWGSAS